MHFYAIHEIIQTLVVSQHLPVPGTKIQINNSSIHSIEIIETPDIRGHD